MSAESRAASLIPRTGASQPSSVGQGPAAASADAGPEHVHPTPPTPAGGASATPGEFAGGAVGVVATGGFGGGGAGRTGLHPPFWRSRVQHGVHGLSGRTGRRERYGVGQIRANLSNAPTPECECMSMYGMKGARGVMGGPLQPTTPSVEPPVSSLKGSSRNPTTTAPAPIGVLTTGVSPRVSAVGAAVGAEPAGRMTVAKTAG